MYTEFDLTKLDKAMPEIIDDFKQLIQYIEDTISSIQYLTTVPDDEQEYRKNINLIIFLLNQAYNSVLNINQKLFEDEIT